VDLFLIYVILMLIIDLSIVFFDAPIPDSIVLLFNSIIVIPLLLFVVITDFLESILKNFGGDV